MTATPYLNTLTGKRALVTGATRGLGRTIAEWLARAGADLYVSGRNQADIDAVIDDLRGLGIDVHGTTADLAIPADAHRLAEHALADVGHVDILINNAGFSIPQTFWDATDEQWDAQLNVNVRAPFILSQTIGKHMANSGVQGRIVNISTIGTFAAHSNTMIYDIAKSGVQGMTRAMAWELGRYGITANCIAPGGVPDKPGTPHDHDHPSQQPWNERIPMGRLGSSSDIANAVLFFCQPASQWITGQTLLVDGGHISYMWSV